MNGQFGDMEDRLRDAYRAAGDTVRPGGIRTLREPMTVIAPGRTRGRDGLRRRATRGRVLLPLAAAAAIVAVAIGVPALLSGLPSPASRPAGGARPTGPAGRTAPAVAASGTHTATPRSRTSPLALGIPAGAPTFFIETDGGPGTTLYVYRTATARVVAQVTVPHPGDTFQGIAATTDPLSFVVATGHDFTCGSHLYSLRLNADGRLAGYTPLPVPTLPEDVLSFAATPDGRSLGFAGDECAADGGGQGDIGYVNLATRAISRWTAPKQQDIGSLSLSASGSEIGFVVGATKLFPPQASLLATDAPAGTVAERAQVIVSESELRPAGTVPEGAALTPDGRTMLVCGAGVDMNGTPPPPTTPDPLFTFSGRTLTHTTHLLRDGSCGLSLDPSGRFLLAQTSGDYATGDPAVQFIDLATGKATVLPVPAANLQQGSQIFW